MVDKNVILRQLKSTSNEIAIRFDQQYDSEISLIAEELAYAYDLLLGVCNAETGRLEDNQFQSGLLYWGGLNSILASLDLLRRGYNLEPLMLLRNALEKFAVAYDIKNESQYKSFIENPDKFPATKSISSAKKVHSIIGTWYGLLSDSTHPGSLHMLPHGDTPFCIGGIFDSNNQTQAKLKVLMLLGTIDVLNSLLELTFIEKLEKTRFWRKIDKTRYEYLPNTKNVELVMNHMEILLKQL